MTVFFQKFPFEATQFLQSDAENLTDQDILDVLNFARETFESIFIHPSVYGINFEYKKDMNDYLGVLVTGFNNESEKPLNPRMQSYNKRVKNLVLEPKQDPSSAVLYLLGLVHLMKHSLESKEKFYQSWYKQYNGNEKQELTELLGNLQNILLISYGMAKLQASLKNSAENWGMFAAVFPPILGLGVLVTLQYVAPAILAASMAGVIGVAIIFSIFILSMFAYAVTRNLITHHHEKKYDLENYKKGSLDNLREIDLLSGNSNTESNLIFKWPDEKNAGSNQNLIACLKQLVESAVARTYGHNTITK